MTEKISFLATLPPIQSAMSVSGNRDGMRIKLDVPENQVAEAVKLMLYAGRVFRVTIEPEQKERFT